MTKRCPARITRGLNLAECIRAAQQLGCQVEPVHGTGEVRFAHPSMLKTVTVNRRRKDAPRKLTHWINCLSSRRRE